MCVSVFIDSHMTCGWSVQFHKHGRPSQQI